MTSRPAGSADSGAAWSARPARLAAPMAEINVIPLVDVVLVLLIIFMVTTAFVKTPAPGKPQGNKEIAVNLPIASAASAGQPPSAELVLGVDIAGQRYVNGAAVSADQMIEQVKTAAAQNPRRRVRIDADQDTPFRRVVELMEICQFEGLRNVGVHVRQQATQ